MPLHPAEPLATLKVILTMNRLEHPADHIQQSLVVTSELNKTTWTPADRELLHKITEHLLHSDFDEIVAAIDAR
ncbi:MAG: hypothetical protein FWE95_06455 [Planctomycetaceae bacterium]|nr:hypothetical protein [Planctomycetaceae bacterium]